MWHLTWGNIQVSLVNMYDNSNWSWLLTLDTWHKILSLYWWLCLEVSLFRCIQGKVSHVLPTTYYPSVLCVAYSIPCKFLITSCILSPCRNPDPVLGLLNCLTPPLLILTVTIQLSVTITSFWQLNSCLHYGSHLTLQAPLPLLSHQARAAQRHRVLQISRQAALVID